MKKYFKHILLSTAATALAIGSTGCLEESFPENDYLTADQIANADSKALLGAIPAYLTYFTDDDYYDIGFAGFLVWRDTQTADFPMYSTTFDYFSSFACQLGLGNTQLQTVIWRRHYYMIQKCDIVLNNCKGESEKDQQSRGVAYAYRASTYLDLARWFEYKKTDVAYLDDYATSNGIYGLTVPLITEETTEAQSRQTPRAPFYEMYRFILTDLDNAETCLKNYSAPSKMYPTLGVVYGLKARTWLELASRFELYPDQLATALANESNPDLDKWNPFGVTTAQECYAKAQSYARLAINQGYSPYTENQWYDPTTGFNTPNNSWMLGIIITADNDLATVMTWQSWPSFLCPEATYGISSYAYGGYKMLDARLYEEMDANDWRRDTWIAPGESADEQAFNSKYAKTTTLSFAEWSKYADYCGFKFHPNAGNGTLATTGNAVSIPLMRVEEMYLIEAEAAAHAQGAAAGKQLIESFMNTYRMKAGTTFTCGTALEDVINAIWTQKRIELWGEGLCAWDYKRRELAVVKDYPGTNHPTEYQFNSLPNAVAPWLNVYIPDRVRNLNATVILNPDPSSAIAKQN